MKHYSRELKLKVIRMFYEDGKTRAMIAKELGLRSPREVEAWVREYRQKGELAFTKSSGRPQKIWDENAHIQQLEMEVALLKKYHTELRKSLLAKRNIGLLTITGKNTK
jgi:transposase-like protein